MQDGDLADLAIVVAQRGGRFDAFEQTGAVADGDADLLALGGRDEMAAAAAGGDEAGALLVEALEADVVGEAAVENEEAELEAAGMREVEELEDGGGILSKIRSKHLRHLQHLLTAYPVLLLVGARPVGKTTIARTITRAENNETHFLDVESSADLAYLADAELSLGPLRGLIVLDEIQRRPELFPALRALADRPARPARFLVLGSAAPRLLRQSSESLAGRVAHYPTPGISLSEMGPRELNRLWLRGGFPPSLTAPSDEGSYLGWTNPIRTLLERDVPQFGINIPSVTLDRFWAMLSHYHGQVWNGSEFARAFGVAHHAVRRCLDALESTYMVQRLKPWAANLKKRQVKSPKICLRDTGILHQYLEICTRCDLERHPNIGASWEGLVIEAAIQSLGLDDRQCHFWATHDGTEIDLVVQHGTQLRRIEVKRTSSPSLTPSMKTALSDLGLSRIDVIHAGAETYSPCEGCSGAFSRPPAGRSMNGGH